MAATIILPEWLVIHSVPLGIRACFTESMAPLYEDPEPIGENVHIPTVAGRTAYRRDRDELEITLILNVDGRYTFTDDSLRSNPRHGLYLNRKYLRDNLGSGLLGTGDGTVTAVWHQADGSTTVTKSVQVLGLSDWIKLSPYVATARLDLVVPSGAFA